MDPEDLDIADVLRRPAEHREPRWDSQYSSTKGQWQQDTGPMKEHQYQ